MQKLATKIALFLILLGSALAVEPARAEIFGVLESPVRYASQISNVQGWVYTTTPGAELIQPFEVFIDGEKIQDVPCCSDRGDVQGEHPEAPLQTGFSGVVNWSREALLADESVVISIEIRDTAGGLLTLEENLDLYAMVSFPFSRSVGFAELDGIAADGPGAATASRCSLSNVDGPGDDPVAQLACTNLTATKGDGSMTEVCDGTVEFTWDKASQGFKQSSFCEPMERWTDHGDGTATDNTTGLMWELKTGDHLEPETRCEIDTGGPCNDPHLVTNRYQWSLPNNPYYPDGSAFSLFLRQLNTAYSEDGVRSSGCFAGHCDWRLPTVEELRAIRNDCDTVPCTSIPGSTDAWWYWSSTLDVSGKATWDVAFAGGGVLPTDQGWYDNVRAVRGASSVAAQEDDDEDNGLLIVEIAEMAVAE